MFGDNLFVHVCVAALTDSAKKRKESEESLQERRRTSVENGINKELEEYPEELRDLLKMPDFS